mmetsp:Transcript_50746/g.158542  ORF Transcript_50746/g.158542 Transcript_50746/m.158542 type:complete len:145 (+) Transcript_50746:215-649(+)
MPSGCLTLFIINKAGGLIYTRVTCIKMMFFRHSLVQHFSQDIAPLNVNDCLRLASTFHSMHAIAGRLTPVGPPTGIETLEADSFRLECYQSPTGMHVSPDQISNSRLFRNQVSYARRTKGCSPGCIAEADLHHILRLRSEESVL